MSPNASTRQPIPRTVQDANLPQIMIDTKFNQGYTVASSVNGGGQVLAVCNGSGNVEAFTQGTDYRIWNFYQDSTSDTGYSGVATPITGGTISVACGTDGNLVVFGNMGTQLNYILEQPRSATRWSDPLPISIPRITGATNIGGVFPQLIGGQLYLAVLVTCKGATGTTYALCTSTWNAQAPALTFTGIYFSSVNCCWLGADAGSAAFACVDVTMTAYNMSSGTLQHYNMNSTFTSVSVSSVLDANNQSQVFAILADGNVYALRTDNGQQYYWMPLCYGMTFRQVAAALDGNQQLTVFGVAGNNQLYNWSQESATQTGFSNMPLAIATGVASMSVALNDSGAVDLFTLGSTGSTLQHLYYEDTSTNWVIAPLEVPTNGGLQQFVSYSTDITAYDATGVPLVNQPVTIYASEESSLEVNGGVFFVSSTRPIRTSTNAAGLLSITQAAGSLSIPVIEINYTGLMPAGSYLQIDPSATSTVQNQLATVTGTDLMNAKEMDGTYMISDEYRTQENMDAIAQSLNQTVGAFTNAARLQVSPYAMMRHGARTGVYIRREGTLQSSLLPSSIQMNPWRLHFQGNQVRYQELTPAALEEVLRTNASIPSADGIFDWIGSIGDFLSGVVEGVINVVEIVVQAVANAVTATITFIIDGVTYLWDAVLTVVQEALDLAQTIFATVKAFLEAVWQWIGFLFNWNDILRTHDAVSWSINQFIGFVTGSIGGIQTIVDNGFSSFSAQVQNLFQYAITNIAGQYTIGGYVDENEPQSPSFEQSMSNNIMYTGIVNNPTAAASVTNALIITQDDPVYSLLQQMLQMGLSAEATQAFQQALAYFEKMGGSPDQIFQCALAGLLSAIEGVVLAAISGAQQIADNLLQLGQTLMEVLQSSLNEKWDIPILSQLYKWLTGSDLTTLDLIAMIVAIPATFTYKIIYNTAPLGSNDSLNTFKQQVTTANMLAAAGFGPNASLKTAVQAVSAPVAQLMAVFAAVGTTIGGWVTAVNDAFPTESPAFLSKVIWALNAGAQVASFPWWVSTAAPSCNPDNNEGALNMAWLVGNLGLLMDAVFIKIEKRIPESTGDAGLTVQLIYAGLCHTPMAIIASIKASATQIAANILPVIPEICKLCKYESIVTATEGISLAVIAAVDALGYTAAGIVGFVAATNSAGVAAADAQPALAI